MNEAIMTSVSGRGVLEAAYRVGPEDLLEIDAYNVEELKKTVRVNSDGNIALPLIGIIQVKGLTTPEIEQFIARKLDKYVEETVVTVFVKEYKSQRISVFGAVNKPATFSVTGQKYLIDMLMMAEGLSPDAGGSCYVIRPNSQANPNGSAETVIISLDELLTNGNFSLNLPLFAGDVLHVPKGGVFFIDGAVRTPGAYTMKGRMTLVQAVSMAQGVQIDAALDEIRILRDNGRDERDLIVADYDAIRQGIAADVPVSENDIIIVPYSGVKSVLFGVLRTVRGAVSLGGMSLGF